MAMTSATPRTWTTPPWPPRLPLLGKDNLSARTGQEAAVFRYNHSQDYVNLVLRIMEAYSAGDYTAVPSGTYGGTSYSPSYSSAIDKSYKVAKDRKIKQKKAQQEAAANGGSGSSSSGATGSGLPDTPGSDGGGSGDSGGNAVDNLGDAVGGAVGDVTGGGGSTGGGSTPAPDPVQHLSKVVASTTCLAEVGVSTVLSLVGGRLAVQRLHEALRRLDPTSRRGQAGASGSR